jgi:hypothetical protein
MSRSTLVIFGTSSIFNERSTFDMMVAHRSEPQGNVEPGILPGNSSPGAAAPPSFVERMFEKALDNLHSCIWAVVQALLIARFVKKRNA